jgi:hypothetical protein
MSFESGFVEILRLKVSYTKLTLIGQELLKTECTIYKKYGICEFCYKESIHKIWGIPFYLTY